MKDAATNISLSPESEDNEYCTGDTLTVTLSSNPAVKQFIWYIWNNESWEVHILQGQIRIRPVIFHVTLVFAKIVYFVTSELFKDCFIQI